MHGQAENGQVRGKLAKVDFAIFPAIGVLAFGCVVQSLTYLNHDVGWVLYSSQLMLRGAVFGKDIVEPNPPFVWWISTLPAAIAGMLGLPVIALFRAFVAALAVASLAAVDWMLRRQEAARSMRIGFLACAAYLFAIAVHRDFGQREHFSVILVLPYVLTVAHRLEGRDLGFAAGLAVGAGAALGLAFKPYFLLVPLLLEGALLYKVRSFRALVRPEALGAILAALMLAAALLITAQAWLLEVLPDIQQIYWAFERPMDLPWLGMIAAKFALPVFVAVFVVSTSPRPLVVALLLAAAGFAAAAVAQGKSYSYHLYPVLAFLLLAGAAGFAEQWKRSKGLAAAMLALLLAQNITESVRELANRTDRGGLGRHISSTVAFVAANTARGSSFLAVSTHPYPGFPTALYADRRWASTTNSQFYLPAVVRLRQSRQPQDAALTAFAERKARSAILRDLAQKPDVVLIDQRQNRHAIGIAEFDFLEFYLEDPQFRAAWARYRRAPSAPNGFAAYVKVRS